jgi:hypothetical protein
MSKTFVDQIQVIFLQLCYGFFFALLFLLNFWILCAAGTVINLTALLGYFIYLKKSNIINTPDLPTNPNQIPDIKKVT